MMDHKVGFRLLSVALALCLFSALGFAQQAPSSPAAAAAGTTAPQAAAGGTAALPTTRDGKPQAKALRAACRTEAAAKGLKTREQPYRDFMRDCIGKQRPDLVKAFDCRKEARDKNVAKSERRAYIKQCRARG